MDVIASAVSPAIVECNGCDCKCMLYLQQSLNVMDVIASVVSPASKLILHSQLQINFVLPLNQTPARFMALATGRLHCVERYANSLPGDHVKHKESTHATHETP